MKNIKIQPKNKTISYILFAILLLVIPVALRSINYAILICCFFMLYIIAVSGLDIIFGYCGQISMGHAAFFAIGAYGSALLNGEFNLPIILTMIIASILAAIIGALVAYPASRLVFHFLSLATMAFGEIVYQLISHSPNQITGNFSGYFPNPVSIFGFELDTYTRFYYFALVCAVIFLIVKTNLIKSKIGRGFIAIRENVHAAGGMGINVSKYKIIAFATSAFYTAFAGAMYAHLVEFISPDTFMYKQSVLFLTMLLFGGSGSLIGPILGAGSILMLNELLREAQQYQMLTYGVLLLLVIILIPGGVYGTIKKAIEKNNRKKQGREMIC